MARFLPVTFVFLPLLLLLLCGHAEGGGTGECPNCDCSATSGSCGSYNANQPNCWDQGTCDTSSLCTKHAEATCRGQCTYDTHCWWSGFCWGTAKSDGVERKWKYGCQSCINGLKLESSRGGTAGTFCNTCPEGHYCTGDNNQHVCPAGYDCFTNRGIKQDCPRGRYCHEKTLGDPPKCPKGTYGPNLKAYQLSQCLACPSGHFGDTAGLQAANTQTTTNGCQTCSGGYYGDVAVTGLTSYTCSGECPAGFFCPGGTAKNECGSNLPGHIAGPAVYYCPAKSASRRTVTGGYYTTNSQMMLPGLPPAGCSSQASCRDGERVCEPGTYCLNGVQWACPLGKYGKTSALSAAACSGSCAAGYDCDNDLVAGRLARDAQPGASFYCGAGKSTGTAWYCPSASERYPASANHYTIPETDTTGMMRTGQKPCGIENGVDDRCKSDATRVPYVEIGCVASLQLDENHVGATATGGAFSATSNDAPAQALTFAFEPTAGVNAALVAAYDEPHFQSTGELRLKAGVALNHEDNALFQIQVFATDALGRVSARCPKTAVTITNVNDAPTWAPGLSALDLVVEEGAPAKSILTDRTSGTSVAALATDGDGDQVSYSIVAHASGIFTVGSCDGIVRVATPPVFDHTAGATNTHTFSIRASDDAVPPSSAIPDLAVTVTVVDRNDAPAIIGPANGFTIAESSRGCSVAQRCVLTPNYVVASDPDGHALTYVLEVNDQNAFAISPSDGLIWMTKDPDYEERQKYVIEVSVTDGTKTVRKSFQVGVMDVNEPPVPGCTVGLRVLESAAIGFSPGNAVAYVNDPECVSSANGCNLDTDFTYALDEDTVFKLASAVGPKIAVATQLDFETMMTYSVLVSVTDKGIPSDLLTKLTGTCTLTITIEDVNEPPTVAPGQVLHVNETAPVGFRLPQRVNATDPDNLGRYASAPRQSLMLTLVVDDPVDPGKFDVDSDWDALAIVVAGPLQADGTGAHTAYTLVVKVTDNGHPRLSSADTSLTVAVDHVNEPPTLIIPAPGDRPTLPEHSGPGVAITRGQLSATDPDDGDDLASGGLTMRIVAGAAGCADALNSKAECRFVLSAAGLLAVNSAATIFEFDFEADPSFSLFVSVTDRGGLSDSGTVVIELTNENDPPVLAIARPALTVLEAATADTYVGTFSATDDDLLSTTTEELTFSISAFKSIDPTNPGAPMTTDDGTWKLVPVAPAGISSAIRSTELRVKASTAALGTNGFKWELQITVTDKAGLADSGTVEITVENTNRPPQFKSALTFSLEENKPAKTLVATLAQLVVDPDGDPVKIYIEAVSLSNGGTIASAFAAQPMLGRTLLESDGPADYETGPTYRLSVSVRDEPTDPTFSPMSSRAWVTVNIIDVNEPPVLPDTPALTFSVKEDSPMDTWVGNVTATDPDADDNKPGALTYSLFEQPGTAPGDIGVFRLTTDPVLNRAVLRVAVPSALDYESHPLPFVLGVRVKDNGGLEATSTIRVELLDVNEPPKISGRTVSHPENNATFHACLPFKDADSSAGTSKRNTFAIVAGNSDGKFELSPPGEPCVQLVSAPLDFEDVDRYDLVIQVDDGEFAPSNATLVVLVTNVNDVLPVHANTTNLPTTGGTVDIIGSGFGPTARKMSVAGAPEPVVEVQFGRRVTSTSPGAGSLEYSSSSCSVLVPNTVIRCRVGAGLGANLLFSVSVKTSGSSTADVSPPTKIGFSFAAPEVHSVTVLGNMSAAGGLTLTTSGGETIVIRGANFGPVGQAAAPNSFVYGYPLWLWSAGSDGPSSVASGVGTGNVEYVATDCDVTRAHVEMHCKSVSGAGRNLRVWIKDLAGQASAPNAAMTLAYAAPTVSSAAVLVSGAGAATASFSSVLQTSGNEVVIVTGDNFGPLGTAVKVDYGVETVSELLLTAADCHVHVAHIELRCKSIPGVGTNQHWRVTAATVVGPWSAAGLTGYLGPNVTSVDGNGAKMAKTVGGERFTVSGANFGPLGTAVSVSYGHRTSGTQAAALVYQYGPISCTVVTAHVLVECFTVQGTGKDHMLVLTIAGQTSSPLRDGVSYAAPVVTGFAGPGALDADTRGGQMVVITGHNFGPRSSGTQSTIDAVTYSTLAPGASSSTGSPTRGGGGGNSGGGMSSMVFSAANCTVAVAHTEIHCNTIPGAGVNLKWTVVIDGQQSRSPTTSYAAPQVLSLAIEAPSGGSGSGTGLTPTGGDRLVLTGRNFGPASPSFLESVTYGTTTGTEYTAKACSVTKSGSELVCESVAGTGASLNFIVRVGSQVSRTPLGVTPVSTRYRPPTVTHMMVVPEDGTTGVWVDAASEIPVPTAGAVLRLRGADMAASHGALQPRLRFATGAEATFFQPRSVVGDDLAEFEVPAMDSGPARQFYGAAVGGAAAVAGPVPLSYTVVGAHGTITESNSLSVRFAAPVITGVYEYVGKAAPVRLRIVGHNFGGSSATGEVWVDGSPANVARVNKDAATGADLWTHELVEIETGVTEGSVVLRVWGVASNMAKFDMRSPTISTATRELLKGHRFSTRGGETLELSGSSWDTDGVKVTVGGQEMHIHPGFPQLVDAAAGTYRLLVTVPPGQGRQPLVVSLQGGVGDSTEPVYLERFPPSAVVAATTSGATTGATVAFTGLNLGTCVRAVLDNVVDFAHNCSKVDRRGADGRDLVVVTVPDGDGQNRILTLSAGGLQPSAGDVSSRILFSYDPPAITTVSPRTADTRGGKSVVITGRNFGVRPAVIGLYSQGRLAVPCDLTSRTHYRIECILRSGQGLELTTRVTVGGQHNSEVPVGQTFSFAPPRISAVTMLCCGGTNGGNMTSPTTGGGRIQLNGASFGTTGAIITLVGDGVGRGAFGTDIVASATDILSQDHETLVFQVPPGQGRNRLIKLSIFGQEVTFPGAKLSYDAPFVLGVSGPPPCTALIRDRSCGAPTSGGWQVTVLGRNLGAAGVAVTVGGRPCQTEASPSASHESASCPAPRGSGAHQLVTISFGYPDWDIGINVGSSRGTSAWNNDNNTTASSTGIRTTGSNIPGGQHSLLTVSYDPPYINRIMPQTGNANGQHVVLEGINFGTNLQAVNGITIGSVPCKNLKWDVDIGAGERALACWLGGDEAGPKNVSVAVDGQMARWSADGWDDPGFTHLRLYRTKCPPNYFGDGSGTGTCIECPYLLTADGQSAYLDFNGEKQYIATCSGGDEPPVAKAGYYGFEVNSTSNDGVRLCNATAAAKHRTCHYVLACMPPEACNAGNNCSVVLEGERDTAGKRLEEHGYSNHTMAGEYQPRCSSCARNYYRVGGLCEPCPKNFALIAAIFLVGALVLCVAGYFMHVYKVNLAMISVGIDYFQVLSMFLKSKINWPPLLRSVFRFLASFNFDLDIASPECILQDLYKYEVKWFCIEALPIAMAVLFLLAHVALIFRKWCCQGRRENLNRHAHAMVSMNLVMMYFLYLYLTRSALDVFNCVPLDGNPDGFTYSNAIGGVRCYELGGRQTFLIPFAALSLILYTVGFPVTVLVLFRRNGVRIQRDQYLRACGLGDVRDDVNDPYNVYHMRKRYSQLYYQFKPRVYYWIGVILSRKFALAFVFLVLRNHVDYMLAASLLVMFVSFALQVINRPYMGPAEYAKVRKYWGSRTKKALDERRSYGNVGRHLASGGGGGGDGGNNDGGNRGSDIRGGGNGNNEFDRTMGLTTQSMEGRHFFNAMRRNMEQLEQHEQQHQARRRSAVGNGRRHQGSGGKARELGRRTSLAGAPRAHIFHAKDLLGRCLSDRGVCGQFAHWLVNHNSVEAVLLACGVLVNLSGIMLSSTRFANGRNYEENQFVTWMTLAIIFLSFLYYGIILVLEIVAQMLPRCLRQRESCCCRYLCCCCCSRHCCCGCGVDGCADCDTDDNFGFRRSISTAGVRRRSSVGGYEEMSESAAPTIDPSDQLARDLGLHIEMSSNPLHGQRKNSSMAGKASARHSRAGTRGGSTTSTPRRASGRPRRSMKKDAIPMSSFAADALMPNANKKSPRWHRGGAWASKTGKAGEAGSSRSREAKDGVDEKAYTVLGPDGVDLEVFDSVQLGSEPVEEVDADQQQQQPAQQQAGPLGNGGSARDLDRRATDLATSETQSSVGIEDSDDALRNVDVDKMPPAGGPPRRRAPAPPLVEEDDDADDNPSSRLSL